MTVPLWNKSIGINPAPCTKEQDYENWAAVIRALRAIRPQIGNSTSQVDASENISLDGPLSLGGNFGIIFKNNEAFYCPWRGVVRITDLDISGTDPLFNYPFYDGYQPNTTFQRRYLVNVGFDVGPGEFGIGAFLYTPAFVLIDGDTDGDSTINEEWGAEDGSWALRKNRPGFVMVGPGYGFTPGGELYSGARFGEHDQVWMGPGQFKIVEVVIGKASGTISASGGVGGTVAVWAGTPGAETDTGQTITGVSNRTATTISSGDWVSVSWPHGKPYASKLC